MVDQREIVLIVTNKMDLTADMVVLALQGQNIPYARFNTEDFPQRVSLCWKLSSGKIDGFLELPRVRVKLSSIRSVWFRRPAPPVVSSEISDLGLREFAQRESQEALSGLWRTLDCFWMSHPDAINEASYKPRQLKVAQEMGFQVPKSLISNSPSIVERFRQECGGRIVAKTLHSGLVETQDGTKVIFTTPVDTANLSADSSIELAPTLFQEYVQKKTELRVTIIGDSALAAEIESQSVDGAEHDWRRAAPETLGFRPVRLPRDLAENCLRLVHHFGLAFGAIDMIKTPNGRHVFLELNPNGQWGWLERATGDSYTEAITRTLVNMEAVR